MPAVHPAEGLLDQTLMVLATDFGRTPLINDNDGRDDIRRAFTCLLAGAGWEHGWTRYGDSLAGQPHTPTVDVTR